MNKLFIALSLCFAMSSFAFAQQGGERQRGGGGGGNQQGRNQTISVPMSVLRANLPLTTEKLNALEADLKILQAVQLPAEAVTELKLTAEQKKSLTDLGTQAQTKVRELMQSGDRDGAMALRDGLATKVQAVLTADQKKVVEKYPAPRMGGGRNRPSN
jgi:hypothetical protein